MCAVSEVERLQAELVQARTRSKGWRDKTEELDAELQCAQDDAQRFRDALEQILDEDPNGMTLQAIASDALAGDK